MTRGSMQGAVVPLVRFVIGTYRVVRAYPQTIERSPDDGREARRKADKPSQRAECRQLPCRSGFHTG